MTGWGESSGEKHKYVPIEVNRTIFHCLPHSAVYGDSKWCMKTLLVVVLLHFQNEVVDVTYIFQFPIALATVSILSYEDTFPATVASSSSSSAPIYSLDIIIKDYDDPDDDNGAGIGGIPLILQTYWSWAHTHTHGSLIGLTNEKGVEGRRSIDSDCPNNDVEEQMEPDNNIT